MFATHLNRISIISQIDPKVNSFLKKYVLKNINAVFALVLGEKVHYFDLMILGVVNFGLIFLDIACFIRNVKISL